MMSYLDNAAKVRIIVLTAKERGRLFFKATVHQLQHNIIVGKSPTLSEACFLSRIAQTLDVGLLR